MLFHSSGSMRIRIHNTAYKERNDWSTTDLARGGVQLWLRANAAVHLIIGHFQNSAQQAFNCARATWVTFR